jgi:hypothetical protein
VRLVSASASGNARQSRRRSSSFTDRPHRSTRDTSATTRRIPRSGSRRCSRA